MHRTRRRTLLAIIGPGYRGPARRDGGSDDAAAGSTEGGSGSTDTGAGKAGDDTGDTTKVPKIEGDVDKERAARSIAAAREGEKKAKDAAKAADARVAAVLKAAGLTPDGKTDPAEQLKAAAEERDKAQKKLRDKSLRLSVRENAAQAGVDPTATIDSSSFRESVAELDLDAPDYDDQVVAAMKKALKANSRLAATPAGQGPGRQGADHSGGGGAGKERPKSLREAFARKNNQS